MILDANYSPDDFLDVNNFANKNDLSGQNALNCVKNGLKIGSFYGKIAINMGGHISTEEGEIGKLSDANAKELLEGLFNSGAQITFYSKDNGPCLLQKGHSALTENYQEQLVESLSGKYKNVYVLEPLEADPFDNQIKKIATFYNIKNVKGYNSLEPLDDADGIYVNKEDSVAFVFSNTDLMKADIVKNVKNRYIAEREAAVIVSESMESNYKSNKRTINLDGQKYICYVQPKQTVQDQQRVFVRKAKPKTFNVKRRTENQNSLF
jgi:hypothetical protein